MEQKEQIKVKLNVSECKHMEFDHPRSKSEILNHKGKAKHGEQSESSNAMKKQEQGSTLARQREAKPRNGKDTQTAMKLVYDKEQTRQHGRR